MRRNRSWEGILLDWIRKTPKLGLLHVCWVWNAIGHVTGSARIAPSAIRKLALIAPNAIGSCSSKIWSATVNVIGRCLAIGFCSSTFNLWKLILPSSNPSSILQSLILYTSKSLQGTSILWLNERTPILPKSHPKYAVSYLNTCECKTNKTWHNSTKMHEKQY